MLLWQYPNHVAAADEMGRHLAVQLQTTHHPAMAVGLQKRLGLSDVDVARVLWQEPSLFAKEPDTVMPRVYIISRG